jgi:hypothetical protein
VKVKNLIRRRSSGDAIDIDGLRQSLVRARRGGFQNLSAWAEKAMQWAEAANAELAMLRPRLGQPHIDGDALVSAEGRRYCLKHPAYELHDDRRCIRCQEVKAWLQAPIEYGVKVRGK